MASITTSKTAVTIAKDIAAMAALDKPGIAAGKAVKESKGKMTNQRSAYAKYCTLEYTAIRYRRISYSSIRLNLNNLQRKTGEQAWPVKTCASVCLHRHLRAPLQTGH